jgi:hypothetical protein
MKFVSVSAVGEELVASRLPYGNGKKKFGVGFTVAIP